MFAVNERIVYPGHGVAVISQKIEKDVAGHKVCFFELSFIGKDVTILVPIESFSSNGIRRLSSKKAISDMLNMLSEPIGKDVHELTASNWTKRNKEYLSRLRSGSLYEIGTVYRDLKFIALHKELSFGEKTLLVQTENLLSQEISLVKGMSTDEAARQLQSFFDMPKAPAVAMPTKQTGAPLI